MVRSDHAALFYLVNAFERLGLPALIEAYRLPAPAAGWRVLLALGDRLGLGLDDPLRGFLQERIEAAGAPSDDAPLIVLCDDVMARASALYEEDAVWGPALIAVAGRIAATATHLDIFLPMAAVRVEVRRAGLDLDPGWVPWLGRVVTFHYVKDPTLPSRETAP